MCSHESGPRGRCVTSVDSSITLISRIPEQWIVADMRSLSLGRRVDGVAVWNSFLHLDCSPTFVGTVAFRSQRRRPVQSTIRTSRFLGHPYLRRGRCLSIKLNLRMRSAAVKCESDYSTLWSNATPTTLEMAGRGRNFMNKFFRLFARRDRRKLSRSLFHNYPRSSIHTKNTSMQVMLVI